MAVIENEVLDAMLEEKRRHAEAATLKAVAKWLERTIFYVDRQGFIALKPQASKNYRETLEAFRNGEWTQ